MTDKKMQLVDWLDDLCVRFIINLPQEELESVARICFQVEEAQWFYEDFIRPIDPSLPSLNLKDFCLRIFQHCPLLSAFSDSQHLAAYQEFLGYKTRVPVRGAILLNHDMDQVLLVKGWKKGASWSFPRGKINKDEPDLDCAIREVYEETGFDVRAAGLASDPDAVKAIDVTMREQHMRLFVFRSVPEDTYFEPKTRKEISKIQWYKLSELPTLRNKHNSQGQGQDVVNANKFYMVAPFLGPLKKWIHYQRKLDAQQVSDAYEAPLPEMAVEQPTTDAQDPGAELKRLLQVGAAPVQATQASSAAPNEQQANTLLAMLRGNTLHAPSTLLPPRGVAELPFTPLEQTGGYPEEPRSPQYFHPRESPQVRREPPPPFSYASPNGQHEPLRRGFDAQLAPHIAMNQHGISAMHASHSLQAAATSSTHVGDRGAGQLMSFQAQGMQQQQRAQYEPAPQNPPQALSHGPTAPKASQLPAPKLTSHSMNLLNAFKAGSAQGQTPAGPVPNLQSPLEFPAQQRSTHQNSLLDLFRKPESQQAAVAAPLPTAASDQQRQHESDQVVPSGSPLPAASQQPPVKPTLPQRKYSALSMITRTLPKIKLEEKRPAVPEMDAANFPILGMKAALPPQQPAVQDRATQNRGTSNGSPRPPVTILSRPPSSQLKTPSAAISAAAPSSPSRPLSRGKPEATGPQVPVKILQRPTSTRPGESPKTRRPESRTAPSPEQPEKPFQPQLLKRPKPNEAPKASSATTTDDGQRPSQVGGQRDALLALFAKAQAPASKPASNPVSSAASHPTSPLSTQQAGAYLGNMFTTQTSASASPGPAQDMRNVISPIQAQSPGWNGSNAGWGGGASNPGAGAPGSRFHRPSAGGTPMADAMKMRQASMVSHGSAVGSDGLRSPGTPVEAKGFLLDYLNGVVAKGTK